MTNLELILAAREERAQRQRSYLQQGKTLICFTMNIPGEIKDSGIIRVAFTYGISLLQEHFGEASFREALVTDAGPEAYFITELSAEETKTITQEIENANAVGRLFDMDVFSSEGEKISRPTRRACFLCGEPVDVCVKEKRHTVEEAREEADLILTDFAATYLADLAVLALLDEVRLTPKPGLVDAENNGAHEDMDLALFEKSAMSLHGYFRLCVLIGMEDEDCMPALQKAGLQAEKTMYQATGGINTHKGAIYAFGLLLGAMGAHISFGTEIFSTAALLASQGVSEQKETHGDQVRKKYRRCGARHEAEEGFPNAISAYNILCETQNPYRALLWLMSSVQDTNVLFRGGADGLVYMQELAKKTQELDDEHLLEGLRELDKKLTEHHLSPGGCADLLAVGMFLYKTESVWNDD